MLIRRQVNIGKMNKKMDNFNKEMESIKRNIKKNQLDILELKDTISKIKIS